MTKSRSHRPGGLKQTLLALAAAAGLSAALVGASPATAASTQPSPSLSSTQACWAEAETGDTACAADVASLKKLVLQKFNKVIVKDAAEFNQAKATGRLGALAVPASAAASYAIGTLFQDAGYSGLSQTYTTTNSTTCYGGTQVYSFSQLPSFLQDQVSSFNGQGACQVKLYQDINYGGTAYGYYDCRSNLANNGFNDVASSVKFSLAAQYSCS